MQHDTDILNQIQAEVKGLKDDTNRNHQSVDDRLKAADQAIQASADAQKQMSDRLDGLEQKFDRMGETQESAAKSAKSAGELVVEALKSAPHQRVKDWSMSVQVKDDPAPANPVIDTTTGAGLARPAYRESFQPLPRRSTLLSVLPETIINAGSIEIPRETAITGNAAVVPEKQSKPYIGIETEKVLLPMVTIAALAKVTEQMLEDGNENAVRDHIDLVLAHKCDLELERQIINGDGSNGNFSGLLTNSTAYQRPDGDKITALDDLLAAYIQLEMVGFQASAIILHPMDYWALATAKNDVGSYTLSDPRGDLVRRVWNTNMVSTVGMPRGTFLVADLIAGTRLYRRGDWRLALGYVNDDFEKNMITMRKEGRANLAVFNTQAIIKGTFQAAANNGGGGNAGN